MVLITQEKKIVSSHFEVLLSSDRANRKSQETTLDAATVPKLLLVMDNCFEH